MQVNFYVNTLFKILLNKVILSSLKSKGGATMNKNLETYPLSTIIDDEDSASMDQEEAHYEHTMRDVIDLMVVYGFDVVMDDIKDRLEGITIK